MLRKTPQRRRYLSRQGKGRKSEAGEEHHKQKEQPRHMALRQEYAWHVQGLVRRPVWLEQPAPHLCCLGLCSLLQTPDGACLLDGSGHGSSPTAWLAFLLPPPQEGPSCPEASVCSPCPCALLVPVGGGCSTVRRLLALELDCLDLSLSSAISCLGKPG